MEHISREDLLQKGFNEEQITFFLNEVHGVNDENKKLQMQLNGKADLETQNQELQRKLDEINKANMTAQEQIEADRKAAAIDRQKAKQELNFVKAKTVLAGYEVSDELVGRLVTDNEQETLANANMLKSLIDSKEESTTKKVREEISNLNAKPNPSNVPQQDDVMTKEKFDKLTMSQQKEWKNANIDKYHEFYPQK